MVTCPLSATTAFIGAYSVVAYMISMNPYLIILNSAPTVNCTPIFLFPEIPLGDSLCLGQRIKKIHTLFGHPGVCAAKAAGFLPASARRKMRSRFSLAPESPFQSRVRVVTDR